MTNNDGRRVMARLVFGLVGLVFVAACGGKSATSATTTTKVPAASTTSTSTAPPGFTLFTDSAEHFKMATPAAWRQIDPSSPGAAAAIQQAVKANPKLSSVFGAGVPDLVAKGIKFLALDSADPKNISQANVIIKPALGASDSDLPQFASALKTQYQQLGGVVTGTATITLAGHQALQIKLRLPLNTVTGAKTTINESQDVIAANDFLYIVTFAGNSADFSAIEATISVA